MGTQTKEFTHTPHASALKVLLVESDDAACTETLKVLKTCCHQVHTCRSAAEAKASLEKEVQDVDIILAEVGLVTDSRAGSSSLLQLAKERDISAVLLHPHVSMEVVLNGIKLGAVDVLSRPLDENHGKKLWQYTSRNKGQNCGVTDLKLGLVADEFSDLAFPGTPDHLDEAIYIPSAMSTSQSEASSEEDRTSDRDPAMLDTISSPDGGADGALGPLHDGSVQATIEEVQALFAVDPPLPRGSYRGDSDDDSSTNNAGASVTPPNKAAAVGEKAPAGGKWAAEGGAGARAVRAVPANSPSASQALKLGEAPPLPTCARKTSLEDSASSLSSSSGGSGGGGGSSSSSGSSSAPD
uniref:Response regulatory domain-containing protein n=1 Tax=Pyramimonas obovata TaxID=1411642 RepID=A0A7S0WIL5_9CHLO|mmetsp:Transcript_26562/g.57772  ORF Transcript_26562/g.57772 Transcript_26562/m.57772 type:complete len:354 (+) Transcript_26562:151-1212(+)